MSVLIKGMDKETAVRICAYTGVRMDDSDFVPVPPHGRLIDADALTRAQGFHNYKYDNGLMYVEVGEVVSLIKAAPTIIPAEEETNGRA